MLDIVLSVCLCLTVKFYWVVVWYYVSIPVLSFNPSDQISFVIAEVKVSVRAPLKSISRVRILFQLYSYWSQDGLIELWKDFIIFIGFNVLCWTNTWALFPLSHTHN